MIQGVGVRGRVSSVETAAKVPGKVFNSHSQDRGEMITHQVACFCADLWCSVYVYSASIF